jgi:hypothetical protein
MWRGISIKVIDCTNRTQIKNTGQHLNRVKSEKEIKEGQIVKYR